MAASPRTEAATGGVWAPSRRALTVGLVLTITLVAFEALAVATAMPVVSRDLGGLGLYGWVFSAFFLGSLLGIVVAGQAADRRGPAPPFAVCLGLFALGLVAGGAAPSMAVLVAARVMQGFGAGAIPAVAYVSIGRSYPEPLRPRMFAILSTAWVVPGLIGPALSGAVADSLGWRWVFLGLLPLVALAAALTLPSLRSLGAPGSEATPSRFGGALRVAVGAGLVLAGLGADQLWLAAVAVPAGAAVALPALRRLSPSGAMRAAAGLPAAVLVKGVLTFSFFGADAYVPLALTSVRGTSTTMAGAVLTAATLSWTAGAWVQERRFALWGARRLVAAGFACVSVGVAAEAAALWSAVPLAVAVGAWALAGLGMGLAYSSLSLTVLREAPPGHEGAATSAVQLFDVLGVALGTGVGGAAVAAGEAAGWHPRSGILVGWIVATGATLVGLALSRRLPGPR